MYAGRLSASTIRRSKSESTAARTTRKRGDRGPARGRASSLGRQRPCKASLLRSWHRQELRILNVAAHTRIVSVARIRLDSHKSMRPFKGIICDDVSEFESYHLSHAVGSLWRVYPVSGSTPARNFEIGFASRDEPMASALALPEATVSGQFVQFFGRKENPRGGVVLVKVRHR